MFALSGSKVVVGWAVAAAVVVAPFTAFGQASSTSDSREVRLNGLEEKLNRDGRFATVPVSTAGAIAFYADKADRREDIRVRTVSARGETQERREASLADFQYAKALNNVLTCRIEVARRRGVVPGQVAADTAILRWTIERSGAVRDAEAIAGPGTDLEVAACAKRVISNWVFVKPIAGPVTIERAFTFRALRTARKPADTTATGSEPVAGNNAPARQRLR